MLLQAEEWYQKQARDLTIREKRFIRHSSSKQQAEIKEKQHALAREQALTAKQIYTARLGVAGVSIVSILLLLAAILLFQRQRELTRQNRLNKAQAIAGLSALAIQQEKNDVAILLAIEALDQDRETLWLADAPLRSTLATFWQNDRLTGHEDWVRSVAFSPHRAPVVGGESHGGTAGADGSREFGLVGGVLPGWGVAGIWQC